MSAQWIVRPPLLIPWFHREWIGPSLMVGGGSISMEREEWWWVCWFMIVMVTSEASDGYERSEWRSCSVTLLWRKVLECSSSPCSLRHPCVLTHFVIPVSSLTSSSLCPHTHDLSSHPSHRYPWLLSRVISPKSSLTTHSHHSCYHSSHTQCSHTHPHSSHSPKSSHTLTPITCATMLTHPRLFSHHSYYHSLTRVFSHWVFSHPSSSLTTHSHHSSHTHSLIPAFSLTSLLWVLTPITCLLTLTISHRVSPHALSHPSHLCHHTEWFHITCVLRECLFPLPWCRTTTKSTHSLLWENLCSHSHFHGVVLPPSLPTHCSERTCAPTHTPMVSSYHQVYPLTALRECLFPLTLPWCRTTAKCTLTLSSLSHTLPWCRTTTKSSHTHTNPCAPTHSHLPCPHTLCSPHFISPHSHHQLIPTHLPHSPTHRIIITSSPLPITYHHQSLPLTPHNTPNPSISLPTLPIVS